MLSPFSPNVMLSVCTLSHCLLIGVSGLGSISRPKSALKISIRKTTALAQHRRSDILCTRRRTSSLIASFYGLASGIETFAKEDFNSAGQAEVESDLSPSVGSTIPSLTLPLHYDSKLSAYIIYYVVGKSKFGAIIDTGSPFLMVPQTSCRPDYQWGCYRPEESRQAVELKPTRERFDGNEGWVEWREGSFSFMFDESNAITQTAKTTSTSNELSTSDMLFPKSSSMTFGVLSESLMDGPGGIFLGLVKYTDRRIRPSFLGQSQVSAFSIDLMKKDGQSPSLTLYGREFEKAALTANPEVPCDDYFGTLKQKDYVPLTNDLNRKFADPTIHYVAVASSITVNGSRLASTSQKGKLYVIFDTGCSGMTISPDLFEEQYSLARSQKAKNVWDKVDVEFKTSSGSSIILTAKRPITTPLISNSPWGKKLKGHLIVLGLSFLDDLKITIDIDKSKIWFDA